MKRLCLFSVAVLAFSATALFARNGEATQATDFERPVRISGELPSYPEAAWLKAESGLVVIECLIDEHGRVIGPAVVQSASDLLDAAALAAVKTWTFSSPRRNGDPTYVVARIPIRFVPTQTQPALVARR